ncbi:MAG: hypothetical protein HYZ28_05415 [Myxococcales bacterium]|nr:hypothetical protein [Myxococcales bacterium]
MRPVAPLLAVAAACVGPQDNPSLVKDLRVLGISLEPPELMAPACVEDPDVLAVFASRVTFTALIADPAGEGRTIQYELVACAHPSDRTCSRAGDRIKLRSGEATAGELKLGISPGATLLEDGTPLLQRVAEQDEYKGLGGLRLPLSLRLKAGEEEVFARKLMVFSCRFFREMKQNLTPQLPGLRLDAESWGEEPPELAGAGLFRIEPDSLEGLEEPYVVPSFKLRPVQLQESWKISWHSTSGRISPDETGGTDLGGQRSRHRVEWTPSKSSAREEVTFWAVVRDGRGGQSWLVRRARIKPR